MLNKTSLKEKKVLFFFLITFTFLVIFFTQIHPLMIFDADDWGYIDYTRGFFPKSQSI